ncbi:MAG TPA: hypothetical protein VN901_27845 [Candidatus Acidoferrales bacterium]|nr:hypothetical protein [Candidatus Acidoferrales bacterium]
MSTVRPSIYLRWLHTGPCALAFYSAADADGCTLALPEILPAIKGHLQRSVNKVANRVGPLWQDGSFDHVLRGT